MVENSDHLIPKYDKSNWSDGEWNKEPDRVDFIHEGFSCFILRNHFGNWCGYVGIPNTHPLYGKTDVDLDVHGGITYHDKCHPPICHIPEKGMPEDVWWLGFDTAHLGDLSPARYMNIFHNNDTYKNMAYTLHETKQLAEQLNNYVVKE